MPPSSRRSPATPLAERPSTKASVNNNRALELLQRDGDLKMGATSLRLELQQDHIASLSREADELRDQLTDARTRIARADEMRETERSEMVASYERMLAEQAAAVRQYEARAATVGTLRLEARKREAELTAVRQESVAIRQRLSTVSKVWRHSVIELEQSLEKEISQRNHLEAERAKFAEIHKKKLQSLQREADSRSAEARKLAEREEQAVQAAATAAARQAERSYEIRAKELKAKSDQVIQKERAQHSASLERERANVERERERLEDLSDANLNAARAEAAIALQAVQDAHSSQLLNAARSREVDATVVRETISYLENALETQAAAHKRTEEATQNSLRMTQNNLAQLKDTERDLRVQLGAVRKAHSELTETFEEHKKALEKERAQLTTASDAAIRAAKREAEEHRKQCDEQIKELRNELDKSEETVTRACKLQAEADRNKLINRHKQENIKLQAAAEEKLKEEQQAMRVRLDKTRRDLEKKDKEIRALKEGKGGGGGAASKAHSADHAGSSHHAGGSTPPSSNRVSGGGAGSSSHASHASHASGSHGASGERAS